MKSTDKLENLLGKHPRWNILKEKLSLVLKIQPIQILSSAIVPSAIHLSISIILSLGHDYHLPDYLRLHESLCMELLRV